MTACGTFETWRPGPMMSASGGIPEASRSTTKMMRLTRLRFWPQEEPTVTSTDGRHLAAFFLP